ncbi:putative sulfatase [Thioalkalivibrio nitratireducens DSM 14787]|uniref:Sulfatase n=1 Tax=Thioalkalivibrio nitratireducens (strain DSM 14787 / UNIQEM 213 / ALEN2) TaxID=1255043 RepID=L0DVF6_THIND|nr:sulfatase [Thioalkalivibrio nitratireducens]AGA32960.1 putative sulfatase [Thioalkalivibrio nitratireducens DSM 14787]
MLRLLIIFGLLNLLFLALEIPRHAGFGPNWLALDAALLAGLFALLPPGRGTTRIARLAGWLFAVLTLLTLADAFARLSLSRPVNLYVDYPLARSVYHLTAGNVALPGALLAALLVLLAVAAIGLLVSRLLVRLPGGRGTAQTGLATVLILVGAAGTTAFHAGEAVPNLPRAITPGITLVLDQFRFGREARSERLAFETELERERDDGSGTRLEGLAGIDVIVGFIESYGVSALFDDRYSPVVGARLDALGRRADESGLHVATGLVNAPMFGGQSWLTHASLLSGLWISSQTRYELLLGTERSTLVRDFERTGHRTLAVMPAIVRSWPEGRWYGFDKILGAGDIPYAGPAFNWVTIPDQYVWAHFEQKLRRSDDRPVFAKLALVSSHAPWVPVLPVLDDWDAIGDGSVFRQWEGSGEAPEAVWRDPARVREAYADSVAYALEVAGAYTVRYTDERTLLVLIGDHQPASIITGRDPSPAVPVHVVSGDPALLEPFIQRGFVPGVWPDGEFTGTGMDRFRHWLHEAFGR